MATAYDSGNASRCRYFVAPCSIRLLLGAGLPFPDL